MIPDATLMVLVSVATYVSARIVSKNGTVGDIENDVGCGSGITVRRCQAVTGRRFCA